MGPYTFLEYIFFVVTCVLFFILRISKNLYNFVAITILSVAFVIFTLFLILQPDDEYRAVWFLVISVFSYMIISKKAGFVTTVLSLGVIFLAEKFYGIGISTVGFDTLILSLLISSGLTAAYTSKTYAYELELLEKNDKLEVLATTDSLTGLFNKRAFDDLGSKYVEAALRNQKPLTLLLLDIDHFKKINDNYGHHVGDEMLQAFSQLINKCLRKSDIHGRLGGEEFGLLLFETDVTKATQLASRLLKCVESMEYVYEGKVLKLTVSIGIASLGLDEKENLKSLEKRADIALYQAKDSGRNCLRIS